MKVRMRPARWQTIRQRAVRWSGHPAAEVVLKCICTMGVGFFLAGVSIGGSHMPLATAWLAALGLSLPAFAAYGGGCLGYILLFGMDVALEPMAAGLLVLACLCIFGDQLPRDNRWFQPGCAALFTAVIGFLFLLQIHLHAIRD